VTTLAGLGILIVLLLGAFRTQPAPSEAAPGSSPSVSPSSGAQSSSAPTPVEVVMIPTAITVNINGGNSGLPEWSPILVAVIGVLGAVGSAFITYFVQQGHKEANHGPVSSGDANR
jgi:hypothetical protein